MGAVVSCIQSIFRTIGNCIMAIVNAIAAGIKAIINAIVSLFAIIINCLTCGKGGSRRHRATHHTRSRMNGYV